MTKHCSLTIVLPLYKPTGNWATQFRNDLQHVNTELSDEQLQYIVVHDGPADDQLKAAFKSLKKEFGNIQFLHYEENRGKGYALRHGVRAALSPHVLLIDFDFPYHTANIRALVEGLRAGNDVVVGRRKKAYFRQAPLKRMVVSKFFSTLNRLFISLPLHDTQSGIKGFNLGGRSIFLETIIDRFLVDTEFLMRVHKTNLSVGIVDLDLKPHVVFSNFGAKVIGTELLNFLRVVYLSKRLRRKVVATRQPLVKQVQLAQV